MERNMEFTQTTDAREWAKAFKQRVEANPELALDEGFLIGWFANAIERGRDAGAKETVAETVLRFARNLDTPLPTL